MNIVELFEGKVERVPYKTYAGQEIELTLVHNPSAPQARSFIDRSPEKSLRVLVVGGGIVCWDAYRVEHADVAKMFGAPERGREGKLFIMHDSNNDATAPPIYRFGGGSWHGHREAYVRIPAIARLLASGFAEPAVRA